MVKEANFTIEPSEIRSDKPLANPSVSLISIVIPVYNGEHCISRCLSSIFSSKIEVPFEIIVVDDGSTDSTVSIAQQFPCRLVSIQRTGVAAARNLGIKKSQGKIIFFFDADVKLKEDTIKRFLEHFREDSDAYVIQGRWDMHSPISTFSSKFFLLKYTYNFKNLFNGKRRISVANLETGCLAVRREVFDYSGGFHEGYRFSGGEEHELGARILEKYKIFYYPDLFVEHAFGNIFKTLKKIYRRTVNFSLLAFKNKNKDFMKLHKNSVPLEDKISIIIILLFLCDIILLFFYPKAGLLLFALLLLFYFLTNLKFMQYLIHEKGIKFATGGIIANLIVMFPRLLGLFSALIIYYVLRNKEYKI